MQNTKELQVLSDEIEIKRTMLNRICEQSRSYNEIMTVDADLQALIARYIKLCDCIVNR